MRIVTTIYLVDDEQNLNLLLAEYLKREGHEVCSFFDGLSALNHIADRPDLWVLDIMLGDIDGYALLKKIKDDDPLRPVIFISAKNDQLDRVVGLELGSDDYLPKPFLPRELVIRVQLLLQKKPASAPKAKLREIAGYSVDEAAHTVTDGALDIALTHKEWQLFIYLLDNVGLVVSRDQILQRVWETSYFGTDRVVDDTVRRLRKKMPRLCLETVYQVGYKLVNTP